MPTQVNDTMRVALTDAVLLSNNTPCNDGLVHSQIHYKDLPSEKGTALQQNNISRTVTLYTSVGSIMHAKYATESGIVPSTLYSTVK